MHKCGQRLSQGATEDRPPGFAGGLAGHPTSLAGRVHVIHGDLSLLECDVAVVPTDALLRIERTWHGLVTEEEARAGAPEGWAGGAAARSVDLGQRDGRGPRRVLVEVATKGSEPVEWYVAGVREALTRAG